MVITRLYGGLGNQMFQYAAGIALAARLRTRLVADTTWFDPSRHPAGPSRTYELDAFGATHQILPDGEDQAVLIVGEERWPFPIRLVRLNNTWRFDTQRASSEIVYRRIGRNEMSAIDACGVYVDTQKEYAEKGFAGKGVYARRFISRPGERDGG